MPPAGPDTVFMKSLRLSFEAGRYVYEGFDYDRLADAVAYVRLRHSRASWRGPGSAYAQDGVVDEPVGRIAAAGRRLQARPVEYEDLPAVIAGQRALLQLADREDDAFAQSLTVATDSSLVVAGRRAGDTGSGCQRRGRSRLRPCH